MNLYDFRLGNDFSDKMPKALERKKKLNFLKLKKKKLCFSKNTTQEMKRQPTDQEKTFANSISYKELTSRMHTSKELLQFNNKRPKTQFFKWAKDLNKHFSEETYQ